MVLQLNLVGRRQWISILACVAVFAHLSFCHVYRQFYLENGRNLIDITGPMMVITIKVTSFAWNVYDGLLNDQNPVMTTKNVVALSQQSSWTLHTRITRLNFPSPLQYASYLLFFPSFLAGPAFDYTDFYAWTLPKDHHDTFKPSMERLRYAILYAALSLLLSTNVPLLEPFLDDPQNWSQSGHHSVLNALSHWSPFSARLIAMLCVNEAVMLKFYFIWIAAEGSCIAMGLGKFAHHFYGSRVVFFLPSIYMWPTFLQVALKKSKRMLQERANVSFDGTRSAMSMSCACNVLFGIQKSFGIGTSVLNIG